MVIIPRTSENGRPIPRVSVTVRRLQSVPLTTLFSFYASFVNHRNRSFFTNSISQTRKIPFSVFLYNHYRLENQTFREQWLTSTKLSHLHRVTNKKKLKIYPVPWFFQYITNTLREFRGRYTKSTNDWSTYHYIDFH